MIKKIPLPETIEYGMQYHLDWMIAEALNSIIDHLNGQICNCDEQTKAYLESSRDDTPSFASWFCPKHGRQKYDF